ncbi:MAG: agmatinase [Gammaproteobacteria bacterium]
MPLRNAPLPRMAGDLTFMRSRRATLDELRSQNLAVLGAPTEDNVGRKSGTRFAPTALRETSVYFGWHANPQFSHPVDINVRVPIDTSQMHGRLVDIGDFALAGMPQASVAQAICSTMKQIRVTNASVILLGGDDSIVPPAIAGAAQGRPVGFIQIGGHLPGVIPGEGDAESARQCSLAHLLSDGHVIPGTTAAIACADRTSVEFVQGFQRAGGLILSAADVLCARAGVIEQTARRLIDDSGSLHVHFDVSAFRPSLHGMSERPSFGGLTLADLQRMLGAIGRVPVATLIVTGLNPTLSGLSVVKTGLRLTVTALLAYIYSRLELAQA